MCVYASISACMRLRKWRLCEICLRLCACMRAMNDTCIHVCLVFVHALSVLAVKINVMFVIRCNLLIDDQIEMYLSQRKGTFV